MSRSCSLVMEKWTALWIPNVRVSGDRVCQPKCWRCDIKTSCLVWFRAIVAFRKQPLQYVNSMICTLRWRGNKGSQVYLMGFPFIHMMSKWSRARYLQCGGHSKNIGEARREGCYWGEYFHYSHANECEVSSGRMSMECDHNTMNNFVMSIGSKIIDMFVDASREEM